MEKRNIILRFHNFCHSIIHLDIYLNIIMNKNFLTFILAGILWKLYTFVVCFGGYETWFDFQCHLNPVLLIFLKIVHLLCLTQNVFLRPSLSPPSVKFFCLIFNDHKLPMAMNCITMNITSNFFENFGFLAAS